MYSSALDAVTTEAADPNDRFTFREEGEDSCGQSVAVSLGLPSVGQTETNPRAHAPISLQTAADNSKPTTGTLRRDTSEPIRTTRFDSAERPQFGRAADPAWRPFPAPKRFGSDDDDDDDGSDGDTAQNGVSNKFHWKPAVLQSVMIQSVQHAYAIVVQERMRRELKGPFFKDWFNSVRGLRGWDDGNKFFTNYIAHPMQGAMTGFIFLQNHDRLKRQKFSESRTYWADRLKALAWSAAWSTQWEIGPFSQASIGNVGLYGKGMAYVDLVVTPTVGTGWMITEEAVDRYVVRHLETKNFVLKIFIRTLLNPMRAVANALRFKEPWYRDRPFGT